MLKLKQTPTFKFDVELVDVDGGKHRVEFIGTHKKKSVLQDLLTGPGSEGRQDIEVLEKLVCGWNRETIDAEFSREALEELIDNYHNAAKAILKRYTDTVNGAKLGN